MELLNGFYFYLAFIILSIPAVYMGMKEISLKVYRSLVTLFFVGFALYQSPKAIAYLIAYCVLEFILVKTYLKLRMIYGRKEYIYLLFLILSLSPLVINKFSAFWNLGIFAFLGISYMTFKTVQMIIEIYDGLIEEVDTLEYFNFLLFFPCLTSGPIDRSRNFGKYYREIPSKQEYLELVGTGIEKILVGLMYKLIFATLFYQAMVWGGSRGLFLSHLVYMYSYGFYLFFDFAGYSLMAVGASYIFGIKTPDNFNKPFVSHDMKEFWDRWHMSLSYWFRDFIFSRLMMRFIKKKTFKNKLTGASVGFIINMTIMGVWHGLTCEYILYGLYHGVLLALTEIYQKKCPFHKKYKNNKYYRAISLFITFNLVMFGFFIFSGEFTRLIGKA